MEYVITGLIAWFGASVLAAAGWSRFYSRIARDHPVLDSPPDLHRSAAAPLRSLRPPVPEQLADTAPALHPRPRIDRFAGRQVDFDGQKPDRLRGGLDLGQRVHQRANGDPGQSLP